MRIRALVACPIVLASLAGPASAQPSVADETYREIGATTLELDVYQPEGPSRGTVVVVFGGAWRRGSKEEAGRAGELLATGGFTAFVPNYRLAPPGGKAHFPAPLEDLRVAVEWVREHAADYEADGEVVGAVGWSSGANLALLLGTTGDPRTGRVDAVVALSPPTDLAALASGASELDREIIVDYMGCDPAECPENWSAASPADQVDPGDAPALMFNSEDEVIPVEQVTTMTEAFEEADVPVESTIVEGTRHGVRLLSVAAGPAERFLAARLGEVVAPEDDRMSPLPFLLAAVGGFAVVSLLLSARERRRNRD